MGPQLIPEEVCREVPKQLCQTVFLNPRTVKEVMQNFVVKPTTFLFQVKDLVKYCMSEDGSQRDNQEVFGRDGERDLTEIERLRRPRKTLNKLGKSSQLSNRDRLLRFHQTN